MGTYEYGTRFHSVSEEGILQHIPARRRGIGEFPGSNLAAGRRAGRFASGRTRGGLARGFVPTENR